MLNWAPSEWVSLSFSILAKGTANKNNILNTVKISLQVSIFLSFLSYPTTNSFIHSPIKELSIWCYNNIFIFHGGKRRRWYSIIYKTLNLKFSASRIPPISALWFKVSEPYKVFTTTKTNTLHSSLQWLDHRPKQVTVKSCPVQSYWRTICGISYWRPCYLCRKCMSGVVETRSTACGSRYAPAYIHDKTQGHRGTCQHLTSTGLPERPCFELNVR